MAPHANSRRTPSRRLRHRPIPIVFAAPFDDAPTALDVLMALPPQSRRAILNSRRGACL